MKTGLYSFAELFGNRHIEQLVIPEIQRDYVWEKRQVEHLLGSILENFTAWQDELSSPSLRVVGSDSNPLVEPNEMESLQADFTAFHARRIHATNVGFIYAYSDMDLPGQCFLIDGQQRMTTLYLILLAVASRKDELKERFRARYCLCSHVSNSTRRTVPTKLDYRLREQTTQFLHQWVTHMIETGVTASPAKDQSWYLQRLNGDATVRNLLKNYEAISGILEVELASTESARLYEYIEELVECWYFDTNESSQGEELYIYLNARGEGITENENVKASLLSSLKDPSEKNSWGRIWEEWQDYFWQKRDIGLADKVKNPNADRGFNSYLDCIQNLEKLRGRAESESVALNLTTIQLYLDIIQWLESHREKFRISYSYSAWVDDYFRELWGTFNQPEAIEWSADLSDTNKSAAHNRMILVWGSLLCVLRAQEMSAGKVAELDHEKIFRAIRVIYLRYHNNSRAVMSLEIAIDGLLSAELTSSFSQLAGTNSEERSKWEFLFNRPEEERKYLEEAIWKIEDHPLNLNGRDLGAVNLTHLVVLNPRVSLQQLEQISSAFYALFPVDKREFGIAERKVATVLLYYGSFWNRVSPWYLDNYFLGDWRRTIRGRGSVERSDKDLSVFQKFFEDFLNDKKSLDDFMATKLKSVPVDPKLSNDLSQALIWYSEIAGSCFLRKGMHVEIKSAEEARDLHFPLLRTIWNTQGDFKGYYGHEKISDQLSCHPSKAKTSC